MSSNSNLLKTSTLSNNPLPYFLSESAKYLIKFFHISFHCHIFSKVHEFSIFLSSAILRKIILSTIFPTILFNLFKSQSLSAQYLK